MKKSYREHVLLVRRFVFGLFLFLAIPFSVCLAQDVTPITSSGLNTTVSPPGTMANGWTEFNITGGTRPGGGGNLFHSFGNFDVPNTTIANFLNDSGLATSNILGRVTGGNVSDIFGIIQTSGFGNANLFLMNPAGFLFGPSATINVGGMVAFTSADYLRLADGALFKAIPNGTTDALLSAAPVAAFGFLGSNPGAITVQSGQLTVFNGTGFSLVGGNIAVQAGRLETRGGEMNLVSVGKPSHPRVGGEVANGGEFATTGFKSLGAITLTQGSTADTSAFNGPSAGPIVIRGGQLVMDNSSIRASSAGLPSPQITAGNIEVTAKQVTLSNHSTIDTAPSIPDLGARTGNITFNVSTFSAMDSTILASGGDFSGGAVTIQGLQGSGASAHAVSLTNTDVQTWSTGTANLVDGGPILIQANNTVLNQSILSAWSGDGTGGAITLVSKGGLDIRNSNVFTHQSVGGGGDSGGTVDLRAGARIALTDTSIFAGASEASGGDGGTLTMAAPVISIRGSGLNVSSGGLGHGGMINITGTKAVSLTDGTILSADNQFSNPPQLAPPSFPTANGGTIHIDGGTRFTSQQSTISAKSVLGNGGTIDVGAKGIVSLNDTLVTTAVAATNPTFSGGGIGGNINVTAKHVDLSNHSSVDTSTNSILGNPAGNITFNVRTFSATDSAISATVSDGGPGGAVTFQGLQGSGANAHSVSLTNTTVSTFSAGLPGPGVRPDGGPIVIRADNIELTKSHFNTLSFETIGGPITLVAKHRIESHDSSFSSNSFFGSGGLVEFKAGKSIDLTNTGVSAHSSTGLNGGSIMLSAPRISLSGSGLDATSGGGGHGGAIAITAEKSVRLSDGTVLSADNTLDLPDIIPTPSGGTIHIDGGARFTSQQSTISAKSALGNGGTINVEAKGNVSLNDTLVTTAVSGGPQTVGGNITVDANAVKIKNSQILSTATEGQGGIIEITSHNRHPVTNSVIDTTSQFGTDGTVTIERR